MSERAIDVLREAQRLLADLTGDNTKQSIQHLWARAVEVEVKARAALAAAQRVAEKRAPVQGYSAGIPWSMHLRAYDAYSKEHGPQPAMIDLEGRNCRGGFSVRELDRFIHGWRDELSHIKELETEIERLKATLALSPGKVEGWRVPDGWKLVPVEPDEKMKRAAIDACPLRMEVNGSGLSRTGKKSSLSDEECCGIYRAMLSALPSPPISSRAEDS